MKHPVMKFRYSHWLPKWLNVTAITIYPFILFAEKQDDVSTECFRHEIEHIQQVWRVGWIRFYLSYLLYYLALRAEGIRHEDAYCRIPWEVAARDAELRE